MSQLKESQHLKIPFKVIKEATKNFKTCVGKGGYGSVYKGELLISEQHTTVAVKRLNEKFGQGIKEFLTEIELLKEVRRLSSMNMQSVEVWTLDQYIRHDKTTDTLSWLGRLKICLDAAHGLDYLHNHAGKHQAIIHRDIKSANILLDCDWVAKISDLGFSKLSLAGLDRSTVISIGCGTLGYIEPEYYVNCMLTKESDVYSFGMVLLEILCGRLCNVRDRDGFQLSDYCYKMDKLHTVIDPNLRGEISYDSYLRFKSIAKGCLHRDRKQCLPIYRVVKELEEALKFELAAEEAVVYGGGWRQ
ncbi:putative protein kinase RLK-Pelle-CrRLK1L-1 family [Helianthus annuus]|nr:putative protein kinase RLK-Pelle-CrRLK1L-1 family [Helianthus annuus]